MFTLDQVVPWGRSFDEYRRMFALTDADLRMRILGCADGPASFNAEATRRGSAVASCDPLYQFNREQIQERVRVTYDQVIEQTRQNCDQFVWDTIHSVEHLGQLRMTAMQDFLADYDRGKTEGRYVDAELPALPFEDRSFDLAFEELRSRGHKASIEKVPYEFQRGGNEMMRIRVRRSA